MKVELIECTGNGIHKIARLARATRRNKIEYSKYDMPDIPLDITLDKILIENDEKFVKSLIKVGHLGILEHISFTFHISEISRVTTHQLVRHRLASYLQMSNRHAKPGELCHVTPPSICEDEEAFDLYILELFNAYKTYTNLIARKIPIEDARYVLPPAFFTHISMTMNLRQILHFLELRLSKDTQHEIRELACKIFDICYEKYPVCLESVKELRDKNEL